MITEFYSICFLSYYYWGDGSDEQKGAADLPKIKKKSPVNGYCTTYFLKTISFIVQILTFYGERL